MQATRPVGRRRFNPGRMKLGAEAGQPLRASSLHERLTTRLREMIWNGEVEPGQLLWERDLSELFGISRTPLREAFKVLAAEGLIELQPYRTPRVAPIDAGEVAAMFDVLIALETLAADLMLRCSSPAELNELKAVHAELAEPSGTDAQSYFLGTQRVHAEIVRLSKNPVLLNIWQGLAPKVARARRLASLDEERRRQSRAEHDDLMVALDAGSGTGFAEALTDHNRRVAEAVIRDLENRAARVDDDPC